MITRRRLVVALSEWHRASRELQVGSAHSPNETAEEPRRWRDPRLAKKLSMAMAVVEVPDRPYRGQDLRLPQAAPGGEARVLGGFKGSTSPGAGLRRPIAMSRASRTSSARIVAAIAQPTIRRPKTYQVRKFGRPSVSCWQRNMSAWLGIVPA